MKQKIKRIISTFASLTFERKMMLLVVIAILAGVSFYCWSVWERQAYYSRKALKNIPSINIPSINLY